MIRCEYEEELRIVSLAVNNGAIRMRDLRDLIEATEDAPEDARLLVLPGEIRYEPQS